MPGTECNCAHLVQAGVFKYDLFLHHPFNNWSICHPSEFVWKCSYDKCYLSLAADKDCAVGTPLLGSTGFSCLCRWEHYHRT